MMEVRLIYTKEQQGINNGDRCGLCQITLVDCSMTELAPDSLLYSR